MPSNLIIIIMIMNFEGLNIVPVLSHQGKVGYSFLWAHRFVSSPFWLIL
jgi:hypothetical protein